MRAVRLYALGDIRVEEVAMPGVEADEVMINEDLSKVTMPVEGNAL
jgi:hypothetical protein